METHFPDFKKATLCHYCKQYTTTPVWVTKEVGRGTIQYAFCDEDHAHQYYLNHLQQAKQKGGDHYLPRCPGNGITNYQQPCHGAVTLFGVRVPVLQLLKNPP